jgi:hypothetical protein
MMSGRLADKSFSPLAATSEEAHLNNRIHYNLAPWRRIMYVAFSP